ncbi:MAG: hypothetical protein QM757_26480 [Paludibaculum sp.]
MVQTSERKTLGRAGKVNLARPVGEKQKSETLSAVVAPPKSNREMIAELSEQIILLESQLKLAQLQRRVSRELVADEDAVGINVAGQEVFQPQKSSSLREARIAKGILGPGEMEAGRLGSVEPKKEPEMMRLSRNLHERVGAVLDAQAKLEEALKPILSDETTPQTVGNENQAMPTPATTDLGGSISMATANLTNLLTRIQSVIRRVEV